MDSKDEKYEVKFTKECIYEIEKIYNYISQNLIANQSAKRLIRSSKTEHFKSRIFSRVIYENRKKGQKK